ncbi:MAG TPA: hypothetical protein VHE14_07950 [Solirubrobacteraceae bacterium]|nr:hypothetical protein [Solirubrobacteraceae bacterium]
MASKPLTCPNCASTYGLDERFCSDCGMPLVYTGATGVDQPVTETHERARKVRPEFAEGDLVRVVGAGNQAEAELIQGMLLEEGVPSVVRRTRGFDVPDFIAAGPREVLVPASGAEAARDLLLQTEHVAQSPLATTSPLRLLGFLLAGVALVALVLWLGTNVVGGAIALGQPLEM